MRSEAGRAQCRIDNLQDALLVDIQAAEIAGFAQANVLLALVCFQCHHPV